MRDGVRRCWLSPVSGKLSLQLAEISGGLGLWRVNSDVGECLSWEAGNGHVLLLFQFTSGGQGLGEKVFRGGIFLFRRWSGG